jgi:hypothetical protein
MTASPGRTDLAATLLVLSGPVRGSRIEVPAGGLLFGRAAGPAGRLGDDPALSRWHARLDLVGEKLIVEDLASTNGTLLNGQRISGRQPVRPGDVVTVGASQLQLQALPAPSTAPAQLHTLATGLLPAVAATPPAPAPAAPPRPAPAPPAPAAAHPAPPAPAAAHPAPPPAPPAPAAAHPAPPLAAAHPAPADLWGYFDGLKKQVDGLRQDLAAAGELSRQGLAAAEKRIRELENDVRVMHPQGDRP